MGSLLLDCAVNNAYGCGVANVNGHGRLWVAQVVEDELYDLRFTSVEKQ